MTNSKIMKGPDLISALALDQCLNLPLPLENALGVVINQAGPVKKDLLLTIFKEGKGRIKGTKIKLLWRRQETWGLDEIREIAHLELDMAFYPHPRLLVLKGTDIKTGKIKMQGFSFIQGEKLKYVDVEEKGKEN
jgi:hypothetical protein